MEAAFLGDPKGRLGSGSETEKAPDIHRYRQECYQRGEQEKQPGRKGRQAMLGLGGGKVASCPLNAGGSIGKGLLYEP